MVDFQSRDTRRGRDDDEDDEDGATDDATTETATDADTEETDPAPEPESTTVSEDYGPGAVQYAVVTVTASGSIEDDPAGDAVVDAITTAGDAVVTRELLAPDYDGVQQVIDRLVERSDTDAVVTVGGTGVGPDDVAVDAVSDLFETHLPGFGELFRVLSHEAEGTAIVRNRSTAGLVNAVPVFCLPGDVTAARRGVEGIVLEEAPRIAEQASAD